MVKFDHTIKPGQKGKISLAVVVDKKWSGRKITKKALVETNDPKQKRFILSLSIFVNGPLYREEENDWWSGLDGSLGRTARLNLGD